MTDASQDVRRCVLDKTTRSIRNIPLVPKDDFAPLLQCLDPKKQGQRLPSGPVDAFAAIVQEDVERAGDCDFTIFSSWLASAVLGERHFSTQPSLETYVRYAVRLLDCPLPELEEVPALLMSRVRWAIPLVRANHWVFVYIDYGKKQYFYEDSIPQSGAINWALPLFRQIVDAIRTTFHLVPCDWKTYTHLVRHPAKADAQYDNWSCGIFVMMSLRRFASGTGVVKDAEKHVTALYALERLQQLPAYTPSPTTKEPHRTLGSPDANVSTSVDRPILPLSTDDIPAVSNVAVDPSLAPVAAANEMEVDAAATEQPRTTGVTSGSGGSKRKLHAVDPDDTDKEPDTDDEKRAAKHAKQASHPRGRKKNETERRQQLESDTRILEVRPLKVKCRGCKQWIALHHERTYATTHWDAHAERCSAYTSSVPPSRKSKDAKPKANQTIHSFFKPKSDAPQPETSARPRFPPPPQPQPCTHLRGSAYIEYITRTLTRVYGGVSPFQKADHIRQLFPYKPFLASKKGKFPAHNTDNVSVPSTGNSEIEEVDFTSAEKARLDETLLAFSRWEVNYEFRFVRAKGCPGTTLNSSQLSDECEKLSHDPGLLKSLGRKREEATLPMEEQRKILLQRERYTTVYAQAPEARSISAKLKDPVLFQLWTEMERSSPGACFLCLYKQSLEGKLDSETTFLEVCKMFTDRVRRETSENKNLKYGIRYSEHVINFSILMRSFGSNSAQQYSIFRGAFGGPSPRHLRTLTANSDDTMHNPALRFENLARFKRFVDAVKWTGPIVKAGDCTKVKPRLTYSNELGGHILGSVLDLNNCEVDVAEDIDTVMARVQEADATANQCRAILLSIPLPQYRPFVVALLPANGTDTGERIHALDMELLDMCKVLKLRPLGLAADGAAAECLAMHLMDGESTPSRLSYINEPLGINISAPIIPGIGPVISVTDIEHARKTARNQAQYGTHTASLGNGYFVNKTLVELYETGEAGMVQRDVRNTDKQDDGAARRNFHDKAVQAMVATDDRGEPAIKPGFHGFFVFSLCLSLLFEAWLNRTLCPEDRILSAMRARYFLHFGIEHIKTMARLYPDLYSTQRSFISSQSFNIFNRACDSLILLIIAHLEHYPNDPFCPWLYGTAFVEHFFGLARMLLPNFTYAELLAIVKHILLRQKILLSGQYRHQREKSSASGYILAHDPTVLSVSDRARLLKYPSRARIDVLATIAKREVTSIFKVVLGIIVSKTVILAPLRAPKGRKPRTSVTQESTDSEASDTDNEDDDSVSSESHAVLEHSSAVTVAAREAARYAAVLDDYETTRAEANELGVLEDDTSPDITEAGSIAAAEPASVSLASPLLDDDGKFSLSRALAYRTSHQSETHVHSEGLIRRDPKFNELRQFNDDEAALVTPNEAAHLLSVAQKLDPTIVKAKTAREMRWITEAQKFAKQLPAADLIPQIDSKNITALHPLQAGCFVIMRTEERTYIGEVIELFKKGESGRHDAVDAVTSFTGLSHLALHAHLIVVSSDNAGSEHSDDDSDTDSDADTVPTFSCHVKLKGKKINIHTHAKAATLLYNLGRKQLTDGKLTSLSLSRWRFFTGKRVRAFTKIMIRGGAQK